MKTSLFTSFEAFEASNTAGDYEHTTVIKYNNRICADLMTETASLKVALNRFFKSISQFPEFDDCWKSCVEESIKAGTFAQSDVGAYAFEVEENENGFYIMLNQWF